MAEGGRVTIRILGWNKYNGRADVKTCTWLRLENELSTSEAMFGLDAAERYVFIELLCLASRKQSDTIRVNIPYIADRVRATVQQVKSAIEKLIENETLVKCVSTDPDEPGRICTDASESTGSGPYETGQDETRQDGTGEVKGETPPPDPVEPDEESDEGEGPETEKSPLPRLAELWNEHCGVLRKVRACSKTRARSVKARWDENPNEAYWVEVIQRMAKSQFCQGKKNRPGPHENWKADFDFLLQPDTQNKVLEGKYDDPPEGAPPPAGPPSRAMQRQQNNLAVHQRYMNKLGAGRGSPN